MFSSGRELPVNSWTALSPAVVNGLVYSSNQAPSSAAPR